MALLFMDSTSHYNTAQIISKWTSATAGAVVIQSSVVRYGTSALSLSGGTGSDVSKTLPSSLTTLVVGFALRVPALITSFSLLDLLEGSTIHVSIFLNADGTLRFTRNGTALTNGASILALTVNTWYYIEVKATIADSISADTCQINVNGANWVNVNAGQDTKNAGTTGAINNISFHTTPNRTIYLTDVYITNGTTFLGDCRVDALLPNGNGSSSGMAGSDGNSVDNYALVDESPPTDDTDYVESLTPGAKDLYTFGNLSSTSATIYGVQVNNYARKTDAGSKAACAVVKSGATEVDQAAFSLTDQYRVNPVIVENDPATGTAWTMAAVDALEAGIKVI